MHKVSHVYLDLHYIVIHYAQSVWCWCDPLCTKCRRVDWVSDYIVTHAVHCNHSDPWKTNIFSKSHTNLICWHKWSSSVTGETPRKSWSLFLKLNVSWFIQLGHSVVSVEIGWERGGEGFKKEVKSVRLSKQHFLKSFHSFIQTHIEAYSSSSLDNCMFISISVLTAAAFAVTSSSHVSRFCTITFT